MARDETFHTQGLRTSMPAPPREQLQSACSKVADSSAREQVKGDRCRVGQTVGGGCGFEVGNNQGIGRLALKGNPKVEVSHSLSVTHSMLTTVC